ncbi:radical SAM/SPASM domain-containing protein [Ferrovibrio sp.]|uniref:radical SAM/SPASM domain-containing protein n=1 Tax=Ferrovibrio sp. TaxID=1917215 RepID=UPI0035AFC3FE
MHILFTPEVQNSEGLRAWAAENDYAVTSIQSAAPEHLVPVASSGAAMAVVVDYPITSDIDFETLGTFVSHVQANEGNWYYAPRPNDFVWVAKPVLIGVNPLRMFAIQAAVANSAATVHPLRRMAVKILNALPAPVSKLARKGWRQLSARWPRNINTVNELDSNAAAALSPATTVLTEGEVTPGQDTDAPLVADPSVLSNVKSVQPEIMLPGSLAPWNTAWTSWQAPEATIYRDLTQRGEVFFSHPSGIHVIVLNKCNLACGMCPFHSPAYKSGHKSDFFDRYTQLEMETFEKVAEYAGRHKIALQFGQVEEPLMNKKLPDFVRRAKEKGVPNIHLTTNGTLLTPEKSDLLLEGGLTSLMVSIDAADPETYKKIRGSDLEVVENNLRYFLPRARARGVKTWVSFILQPQAMEERQVFLEKWRSLGVDNVTFYVLSTHDKETGELVDHKMMYERDAPRYPCASPWVQSVVFPDGEVSLCCRTMGLVGWEGIVSVGSLKEQSYEDIWAGERYREVRGELLRNSFDKFKICEGCAIWSASSSAIERTPTYERVYNETMETYSFLEAK